MNQNLSIGAIYINLPVKDLNRSRSFWTALGFGFNEQFSDPDNGLCLILKEDQIYAMLLPHESFGTFTDRPIADKLTTQVLLAIDVGSRDKVDEIIRTAIANGGTHYLEATDHGWMYYDRFADLDGHQWEIMSTDLSLLPKE